MSREVTEFDLRAPEFQRPDVKPEDYEFRDDGKVVRKDRWETGLRNVASIIGWARREFEVPEVVERVRELAEPRFQWTCATGGCGPCDVKRIEFEYERTEDAAGNLMSSKTVPRLVSACCGGALAMWDNLKDEHVDVAVDVLPVPAGVETVYFRRVGSLTEDSITVPTGTAKLHVAENLITRIVPGNAGVHPSGELKTAHEQDAAAVQKSSHDTAGGNEFDEMPRNLGEALAQELARNDDVGALEYRGNSVSFIHSKMTAYRTAIDECWTALREKGIHPNGKTSIADMIRTHIAGVRECGRPIEGFPRFHCTKKAGHEGGCQYRLGHD